VFVKKSKKDTVHRARVSRLRPRKGGLLNIFTTARAEGKALKQVLRKALSNVGHHIEKDTKQEGRQSLHYHWLLHRSKKAEIERQAIRKNQTPQRGRSVLSRGSTLIPARFWTTKVCRGGRQRKGKNKRRQQRVRLRELRLLRSGKTIRGSAEGMTLSSKASGEGVRKQDGQSGTLLVKKHQG